MEAHTKTIDLQDEIESLEGDIEDTLDEAEDVDADSEEFEELDARFKALSVAKEKYEDAVDRIGGSEFEIKELSFGEMMHTRDEVLSHSEEGKPREGLYKVRTLEQAVTDSPNGVDSDPKEWPPTVAEWVYDEVDAMNTGVDEESLGNFSLAEAMENR